MPKHTPNASADQVISLLNKSKGVQIVLYRPGSKMPREPGWNDPQTPEQRARRVREAERDLRAGNHIGVIPASIEDGALVVDVDLAPSRIKTAAGILNFFQKRKLQPVALVPSKRAGHWHVWFRVDPAGVEDHIGDKDEAVSGWKLDLICVERNIILWEPVEWAKQIDKNWNNAPRYSADDFALFMKQGVQPRTRRARSPADVMRDTPEGTRNNTLFEQACRLHKGRGTHTEWDALREAARGVGLKDSEIEATIDSAKKTVEEERKNFKPPLQIELEKRGAQVRKDMFQETIQWKFTSAELCPPGSELNEWLQVDMESEAWMRVYLRTQDDARGEPVAYTRMGWEEQVFATASNNRADSLKEWLDALPEWDGTARLNNFLTRRLEVEDTQLSRFALQAILGGVVARTYTENAQHHTVVIFLGAEGIGKSTLCRHLLPLERQDDWYTDSLVWSMNDNRMVETTRGKVIVESPELAGFAAKDAEGIKAYLSRTHDTYRAPYARVAQDFRRRFSLVGTANPSGRELLPNVPSGHRRFIIVGMPASCTPTLVVAALAEERDQLWAETRQRILNGEPHYLDTDEQRAEQRAVNRAHSHEDVLMESIKDVLSDSVFEGELSFESGFTMRELHGKLFCDEPLSNAVAQRMGNCLRTLGFEKSQCPSGQNRGNKVWKPGTRCEVRRSEHVM